MHFPENLAPAGERLSRDCLVTPSGCVPLHLESDPISAQSNGGGSLPVAPLPLQVVTLSSMPLYCLSNQLDLFLPEAFVLLSSPLVLVPWSLPLLGESSTERTVLCLTFCFMCLLTVTSVRTGHFFSRWALSSRRQTARVSAQCCLPRT